MGMRGQSTASKQSLTGIFQGISCSTETHMHQQSHETLARIAPIKVVAFVCMSDWR